jgi:hypothetical protein
MVFNLFPNLLGIDPFFLGSLRYEERKVPEDRYILQKQGFDPFQDNNAGYALGVTV